VKLYVCWGTFQTPRPGGHPCHNAHTALKQAGYEPEVEKTYGWGALGTALNPTRKPIRELTGQNWVPVLLTEDDQVIQGSKTIVEWARAHPAAGPTPATTGRPS
jgi:hypothetical protein